MVPEDGPLQMLSPQAIHVEELPFSKHGPWVRKQLQVHLRPQAHISASPPPPPAFQHLQGQRRLDRNADGYRNERM